MKQLNEVGPRIVCVCVCVLQLYDLLIFRQFLVTCALCTAAHTQLTETIFAGLHNRIVLCAWWIFWVSLSGHGHSAYFFYSLFWKTVHRSLSASSLSSNMYWPIQRLIDDRPLLILHSTCAAYLLDHHSKYARLLSSVAGRTGAERFRFCMRSTAVSWLHTWIWCKPKWSQNHYYFWIEFNTVCSIYLM